MPKRLSAEDVLAQFLGDAEIEGEA